MNTSDDGVNGCEYMRAPKLGRVAQVVGQWAGTPATAPVTLPRPRARSAVSDFTVSVDIVVYCGKRIRTLVPPGNFGRVMLSRNPTLVAVADQCDQTASPDRLRPSRYSFFVADCMVSLSEKSQYCVSVCRV